MINSQKKVIFLSKTVVLNIFISIFVSCYDEESILHISHNPFHADYLFRCRGFDHALLLCPVRNRAKLLCGRWLP